MRAGLIAKKIGMSRICTEDGVYVPVTLLHVDNCRVISQKNKEKDGYTALQLGFSERKEKHVAKPQLENYKKISQTPAAKLVEFKVSDENLLDVGSKLLPSHFTTSQFVDVVGTSIGKGFAGVIKRHNFRSLRATHGVSITHRSHGSTGNRQDPGKVFKGKKMAGHLGNERVTIQNLQVMLTDDEKNILVVKGAVPGSKGSIVLIKDAIKRPLNNS